MDISSILHNDLALLFLILTLGCLFGKLKLAGVELSASGGVLFVALFLGHHGFMLADNIGTFGFAMFIYAIGFGAGPRFFQTFRRNGIKFGAVALFVALIASAVAFGCATYFELNYLLLPGILAGSLTSTSTLAAAYEIVRDPIMSVGYGITYPFGLVGLLLMIQFLPRLFNINLRKEAEQVRVDESEDEDANAFQSRVFHVLNVGAVAIPLKDLQIRQLAGLGFISIKRGDTMQLATADSVLQLHDHVLAQGSLPQLLELEELIGPEVVDNHHADSIRTAARVVINRRQVVNKTLRELRLPQDLGVILTRIQRTGIDIPINPDYKLERGDVITIVGGEENIKYAISLLGREEHKIYETDILTFSAGLLSGILLGMIKWPLINTNMGSAGGLLFMGILLGYLRNFGPFSGRVPIAARFILQEMGLLLFLASIGTHAGRGLIEHLLESGSAIFITGILVTTVTLMATLFLCRYLLRFDWNTSLGATTGGVTSTVALKIITRQANSQYAVLGYAGVYAFANILLTVLGQVIVRLV
ncbi:hypothetical protein JXO59_12515 [candidate division KSB1 bacterium]|nr:hypothetical protein [candidate division KSB1 bacterium]